LAGYNDLIRLLRVAPSPQEEKEVIFAKNISFHAFLILLGFPVALRTAIAVKRATLLKIP
jgi:hypothetical protein